MRCVIGVRRGNETVENHVSSRYALTPVRNYDLRRCHFSLSRIVNDMNVTIERRRTICIIFIFATVKHDIFFYFNDNKTCLQRLKSCVCGNVVVWKMNDWSVVFESFSAFCVLIELAQCSTTRKLDFDSNRTDRMTLLSTVDQLQD